MFVGIIIVVIYEYKGDRDIGGFDAIVLCH